MNTYSLTKCQNIHGAKDCPFKKLCCQAWISIFIRVESDPYLSNYPKNPFRIDLHP